MNYNKVYDEQPIEETFVEETVVEETPVSTTPSKIGIVNTREVYIRSQATKESEPVGTVKKDEEVFIYGNEDYFYKIETSDGKQGYVMECFVDVV